MGQMELLKNVQNTIIKYHMLSPGEPVLCALSGGADSTALLRVLQELGYSVQAYHLNHCLRGEESERDETFCRTLCTNLHIPLTVERIDVKAAARTGESIETAARRIRYERFAVVAQEKKIATAHTADDLTETVLFHLLRGSALKGLTGIPPVRDNIVRPLLYSTRNAIEMYLAALRQSYVTDSTNQSNLYTRNRIRHEIIPVLREINPEWTDAVIRLTQLLRQDENCLARQAEQLADTVWSSNGAFLIEPLREADIAIRSRALRLLAVRSGMPLRDFTALHMRLLEQWLASPSPSAICSLPHGFIARRIYQMGRFERASPAPKQHCWALSVPFEGFLWDGRTYLSVKRRKKNKDFNKSFNTFCVDCDTISFETLCVRTRRIGDRLRLTANGGSRTLKKWMIDRKIPRLQRSQLAVVADKNGVIAVQGLGVDVTHLVRSDDYLEIQIKQTEE